MTKWRGLTLAAFLLLFGSLALADTRSIPTDEELVWIVVPHLMTHDCDTGELLYEYWGDRHATLSVSGNRVEDCREFGVKKAYALSMHFREKYPNASTNVACKWMTVLRVPTPRHETQVKGLIGYFGLADWWLSAFTDKERLYIREKFSADSLTTSNISYTSETAIMFLTVLTGWFLKPPDRAIAYKILAKAEELVRQVDLTREKAEDRAKAYKRLEQADEKTDDLIAGIEIRSKIRQLAKEVLGPHFMYNTKIELYYKDREKPGYLEKAVEACRQQIELAPQAADAFRAAYKGSPLPWHRGYGQLAIILEKQSNLREAILMCTRAQKEGWAGDWEKRIERYRRKMAKGEGK